MQPPHHSLVEIRIEETVWPYAEPFVISRGAITECEAIEVTLIDRFGNAGRSEAYGVPYEGETPATMRLQIEAVGDDLRHGIDRMALLDLLPPGGARCALDVALWDLESRQGKGDPFTRAGAHANPVVTGYTLGIRSTGAFEAAAREVARCAWIKVKVSSDDPLSAIEAVRRGAPDSALIVDPNQAWSTAQLRTLAPDLKRLGVALIEQPTPVGLEAELDGYACPIRLCADESLDDVKDLRLIRGRFQAVNIKLDKVGGLTAALRLADAAEAFGLDLMVGCMGGTSLAMAPAMVLAQRCRYVDLDGPRLLADDRRAAFVFHEGIVHRPYLPELWGGAP